MEAGPCRRARVAVAAALCLGLVASCGGGGGGSGRSSKVGDKTASSSGSGGSSFGPSSSGNGGSVGSGGSDYSRKLPAKVRVVNLYSRSDKGEKVDVWAGTPQSGKKIGTVDYGAVSDSLSPLTSSNSLPQKKVNGNDVYSYTMSFYTEGGTDEKQQVSLQNEMAFPGDELTILVGTGLATPQSFAPAAGSDVVLFTKTDNLATGTGVLFDKADLPAGKSLLYVSAAGVPAASDPSKDLTFDLGQEGKGCLPEVGPGAPAPGDTHSRSLTTRQSIGNFYYVVSPGPQKINLYGGTDTGCKGQPIAGPFKVDASSGDHVGLLLYGPPDDLKSLVVPL